MRQNYYYLILLCSFQVMQSSLGSQLPTPRALVSQQQLAQSALDLSNTFNPLLDKRYDSEELSNKARAILDVLEPELEAALNDFKCEQIGHYSCDLDQNRLATLLRNYQIGLTNKYDSYAVYILTWMQLKPALWEQLEEREHELRISPWLAGKMQHPTLRYLRKQAKRKPTEL